MVNEKALISHVFEKDVGRIAVSADGKHRICIVRVKPSTEGWHGQTVEAFRVEDDYPLNDFAIIGGASKMYWEEDISDYREVIGDLLSVEQGAIVHCCNCFNTMGSGIAPKIKRKYPAAYDADCATVKGDQSKLGSFSKAVVLDGDLTVYNLYGQYGYSKRDLGLRDLNYNAIFDALDAMGQDLVDNEIKNVALPLIGCGLAGGNWNVVRTMITELLVEKHLRNVTIYKLK